MAIPEKYDVVGHIVSSEAQKGVSSATRVYFFGSSPKGELGREYAITSEAEAAAEDKLGCHAGDGYSLSEAVVAAFHVAGLGQIICIPVSHDLAYSSAWIGDEEQETGIYAYNRILRESPGTVNLLCAPSVTDAQFLAKLNNLCKPEDDIKSYMIYDVPGSSDQISAGGFANPDPISEAKQGCLADPYATAVWGNVRTSGGYSISGAAVRTCLQAVKDAEYGVPARVGGNLPVNAVVGVDGRLFGNAGRYPLFPNVDSSISAASTSDIDDIFINPVISSRAWSYSLSRTLPMFANGLDDAPFPAHVVMNDGEIREITALMTCTASTWAFKPKEHDIKAGESIVAFIAYDKKDDVLRNPVVIAISATYADTDIDLTTAMSGSVNYIGSCDSLAPGLYLMPQSVKVGGVGFMYDGKDVVQKPIKIVLQDAQPVLDGEVCYALKAEDLSAFYLAYDAARSVIIRDHAYDDIIQIRRVDANAMSADGVDCIRSRYGSYITWGDHSSKFYNDSVEDERDRFENQMRMLQYICNWFVLTYGGIIDDGMTLQLRNDIILAVQTKLNTLVGIGALIGQPSCTFESEDNSKDEIAQGHFVFNIRVTGTIPVKYLVAKVRYTDQGLSVYEGL